MNVKKLLDLTGRVALVTGGSRGLGYAMASALGEMGAKVAITARSADELASAKQSLGAAGIDCHTEICDIGRHETIEPMVRAVAKHYGRIDILLNNAGTIGREAAEDHDLDLWKHVMDVNVTGTFLVTQAVGKHCMIPQHYGRIINVASTQGLRGNRIGANKSVAYNTSKGAVVNFTRVLATEWGVHGITVNAIAPGLFPSKMTGAFVEKVRPALSAATPNQRLGEDDDLKGIAVLLSSDASSHITGQIISVDGGSMVV